MNYVFILIPANDVGSYLKRRGPRRLVEAIFCELCVLLLVLSLSSMERTHCIAYVLNVIVFASTFRWNPG